MSIPTNEMVYAGVWNNTSIYRQYQYVLSPIDNNCYVNINTQPSIAGPDPSVQPSIYWVLLNTSLPPFTGVSSLNTLQNAITLVGAGTTTIVNGPNPQEITINSSGAGVPIGHGGFISTINQNLTAGTPLYMVYDTITSAIDCSLVLGTNGGLSAIKVGSTGVYQIIYSIQFDKFGGGGTNNVQAWYAVNGNPVPWSNSEIDITQQINQISTVDIILSLNANDYVEVVGYTPVGSVNIRALANPIDAIHPVAIPSIITDILRIA